METINIFNTSATSPHLMDWNLLNWKKIIKYVKRLRQRIYRAEQLGKKRRVRKLQRLMIRSRANLLLSIKKVTQVNKGKRTAGIDGYKVISKRERTKLYHLLKEYNINNIRPKPAKRTYIPKKNGKLRPLGIPIIKDRVFQNVIKNALEPQWESRFEATSYGFRPKRSAHDAMTSIHLKLSSRSTRKWIFEGDFKGCFDNLSHDHIMKCIKEFPAKEAIYKWLKAGYVDNNVFETTEKGTPQGGIVSPLLANIALHGMEEELGISYYLDGNDYKLSRNSVGLVKYADDFVILCKTKEQAESIYEKLKPYLHKRGLTLAEDKTKITHITEGFDFLGFNVRQYKDGNKYKLIIKPSKISIKKANQKIKEIFKQLMGKSVRALIMKLNPVIRGIGNYWSSMASKSTYNSIDNYIWIKVKKYLKRSHSNKSWKWIEKQYFKPDHTGVSKYKYILTDPKDNKTQLIRMSWIPIVRHAVVKFKNSPDDSNLKEYFLRRDKKEFMRFNIMSKRKLAKKSKYKCRICNKSLVGDEALKINYLIPKILGGKDTYENLELLHISCHIQHHHLLNKYGGGKNLSVVRKYFEKSGVKPSSREGIKLMKTQFKKFKYASCLR